MAQDYLRSAAVKAGILAVDDRRRFHCMRHSLASFLVLADCVGVDVQGGADVRVSHHRLHALEVGFGLRHHVLDS